MDPDTFDTIVQQFAQARSRRSVVAGALGAALLTFTAFGDNAQGKNRRARHGKGKRRGKHDKHGNDKHHKDRKQGKGKAGQEQCLELGQRCRKHGEPCCDGAKCRTLLGLPLIPGRCRCPQGTRECAGACIPESNCCVDGDCGAGAVCQSGVCLACGALGQPCCAGSACTEGVCAGNICTPPCLPDCAGKTCGPDGCGGSCGTCPPAQICDGTQTCSPICLPNCDGKTCGSDGCGGSCGTCPPGQVCDATQTCSTPCIPACAGKNCGPDGCGGSCGTCTAPQVCRADGVCATPPPICVGNGSSCLVDADCCQDGPPLFCNCTSCKCTQFGVLGTGACCTADEQCIQSCVFVDPGASHGVCCAPGSPQCVLPASCQAG